MWKRDDRIEGINSVQGVRDWVGRVGLVWSTKRGDIGKREAIQEGVSGTRTAIVSKRASGR